MAHFSWSDGLHAAFNPCIACLRTEHDSDDEQDHGPHYVPRARPDELEGLLADTDDAETLSLHSNVGDRQGRRKSRRQSSHNGIKLFGFYLFGRPPIHLPDDEEQAEPGQSTSRSSRRERARTISADTLDSDASPLDPSTIDELSAARAAQRIAQQREAERLARDERRRRRRAKKEAQRAALAHALNAADTNEFEGFQGSGPLPALPHALESDTHSSSTTEEFGPYQDGHQLDVDGADFGAEHYARRVPRGSSSAGTSSDRSRTSAASVSSPDPSQYSHHYLSQQQQQLPHAPVERPHHKKRRSSRLSSSSTSQSASVPSPTSRQTSFPAIAEQDPSTSPHSNIGVYSPHLDAPSKGFPSAGLRGTPRRKSEAGVFLARRGEE